jgi:hypothetical protein
MVCTAVLRMLFETVWENGNTSLFTSCLSTNTLHSTRYFASVSSLIYGRVNTTPISEALFLRLQVKFTMKRVNGCCASALMGFEEFSDGII